jgi:hypothetical protein
MVQSQLHFIKYACKEILEYIEMGGEVEEWYQVKIAKSFSEFESLHSFIEGEARRTGMKEEVELEESKPGLYANIHAKRKRIESGSNERMRKPGSEGAPSNKDFKDAAKTTNEESVMEGRKLYKHEGSLEKWTKDAKDAGHEVVHHKGRTDPNSTHHATNKEGKIVGKFFNATYVNNKRGFLHKEEFELDEAEKMKGDDPCWKNYEMIGMKNKNGKKVPNCVPEVKEETDPPFDPDPRKKKDVIPGKHGEGYSKVRHLARQAMRKQIEKMKPVKESLDESRKAEIVKEIMNKKKKSNKDDSETFQKEPILSSEIVKA